MSSPPHVPLLVLGAGPCGLGAATRLHQLERRGLRVASKPQAGDGVPQKKSSDWLLLTDSPEAGGLAMTELTKEGFLFDMGGHVIFSHYDYFDEVLDAACGGVVSKCSALSDATAATADETIATAGGATANGGQGGKEASWNLHQRVSYVWMKGRWIEYPFQNNLYKLDVPDQIDCINGVLDAAKVFALFFVGRREGFSFARLFPLSPGTFGLCGFLQESGRFCLRAAVGPSVSSTARGILLEGCKIQRKKVRTFPRHSGIIQVTSEPKNFDDWILKVMGEGIANIFMRPYNFKVTEHLSADC